jgi:hypothetical protein
MKKALLFTLDKNDHEVVKDTFGPHALASSYNDPIGPWFRTDVVGEGEHPNLVIIAGKAAIEDEAKRRDALNWTLEELLSGKKRD